MARNSAKFRQQTSPNTDSERKEPKHKAAWIGFAAAILAAIIAGTFGLLNTSNKAQGPCSQIITGDIQGEVKIDCPTDKNSE